MEEHPHYLSVADELFSALDSGTARGLTSVLTLQEVLVKPLREGREDLQRSIAANLTLHEVNQTACELAARLRAKYLWLRTPDALQLATALVHGAEVMITNDEKWRAISELAVLVLKDFA